MVENEIIIETRNLMFTHPKTKQRILKGVDLKIYKNEIVVITGKVGSGKTTLLRHLNGITSAQVGEVEINGINISGDLDVAFTHKIGLLFENPDDQIFYPIVVDDVAFGPRNQNLPKEKISERVLDACNSVNILHLLERERSSLSLGEKTMVAISGILAMDSEIILLDTPEVGLDLWTKPDILRLILNLKKQQTVVIATNDLDIVRTADRILLLWNGKIKDEFKNYTEFKRSLSI
ncbi:MAG: energy-coupling factor ABC transporter ATP-binding protein [Candidatus Kariarchaeaceae archaeon]|jgi:energy-coupling factor transporter ATP-binding protein EcfA2